MSKGTLNRIPKNKIKRLPLHSSEIQGEVPYLVLTNFEENEQYIIIVPVLFMMKQPSVTLIGPLKRAIRSAAYDAVMT